MQAADKIPVPAWARKEWPDDAGLKDGTIEVETTLASGYAHARATHDATTAMQSSLTALETKVDRLAAVQDPRAFAQAVAAELGLIFAAASKTP